MDLNIVIRTDASLDIGTGHVMRCLVLADELSQRGANISFICREEKGNLIELIGKKGNEIYSLPANISMKTDKELTREILEKFLQPPDWLIIDNYDIDVTWESSLRESVKRIMVIDDLADRQHDCDILLDQNYSTDGKRYEGLLPNHCILLLGTKYAMLRAQFGKVRENLRRRNGEVKSILVLMGGADSYNQTGKVIRVLEMLEREDIKVEVIIGFSNTHRKEIEKQVSVKSNYTCHFNVENMAELMAAADLSVGAGGSSIWERCCVGLPSIIITVADNQEVVARGLAQKGYIVYSGKDKNVTEQNLLEDLKFVLRHPEFVSESSLRVTALVDGQGAKRVAGYLSSNIESIRLRTARSDDCRNVFEWRNHPDIRKHCFDTSPLSWTNHEQWYLTVLSSSDVELLIGEGENGPVGVLRYDLKKDKVFVSIYIVPELLGMGIGNYMLKLGAKWIVENYHEVKYIIAKIKHQNIASEKTFKEAGFVKNHSTYIYDCSVETI